MKIKVSVKQVHFHKWAKMKLYETRIVSSNYFRIPTVPITEALSYGKRRFFFLKVKSVIHKIFILMNTMLPVKSLYLNITKAS